MNTARLIQLIVAAQAEADECAKSAPDVMKCPAYWHIADARDALKEALHMAVTASTAVRAQMEMPSGA